MAKKVSQYCFFNINRDFLLDAFNILRAGQSNIDQTLIISSDPSPKQTLQDMGLEAKILPK